MSSRSALKTVTPKPVVVKTVPVEVAPKPVAAPVEQIKRSESTISVASESKTRRHLTSVLDINISQARCHRHLKQNLSDATVTQEINSLRETLKDNTKVVEVAKINSQIKDLTRKQRDTKNVAEKAKIQAQINGLMNTLQTNAELSRLCDLFKDETILCSSLVGPIVETIVQSRDGKTSDGIADRDQLRAVKTPQALRANALRALLEVEGNFTDLLSWAHATGLKAGLALAEETNVKLTSQGDLDLMLSLLNRLKIDGPS
jgi:hypothetical protein